PDHPLCSPHCHTLHLPSFPTRRSSDLIYYRETAAPLLGQLDFLLANVHPLFQPWFRDADDGTSAQFVANVVDKLAAIHCGPILVDRKSTRLNSSHRTISYAVFCLKKKK